MPPPISTTTLPAMRDSRLPAMASAVSSSVTVSIEAAWMPWRSA